MIYIHNNKKTNITSIYQATELLHTVTSKYVKNLCEHKFSEKRTDGIYPSFKLRKLIRKLIRNKNLSYEKINKYHDKNMMTLSQLGFFIKKFREIYDEKRCTAREIELMVYIYTNPGNTNNHIIEVTEIPQPAVSKLLSKFEKDNLILRIDNKIYPTNKLNNFLEFSITVALTH